MSWRLACPQCRRSYVVGVRAAWACPEGGDAHGPIRVSEAGAPLRLLSETLRGLL